jgi:hypothetical protein
MNHSILTADINTHVKIASLTLIAVIAIAAVGFNAQVGRPEIATAHAKNDGLVVKAGKPTQFSQRSGIEIR